MQLLEFTPLYKERVWGGRGLEAKLGRKLPDGQVIGESWEIVDRPDEQSVVASGALAGQTIRELLERSAADILGPGSDPAKPFPILVKWLDCQDRLSLQVHPTRRDRIFAGRRTKDRKLVCCCCQIGCIPHRRPKERRHARTI